MKNIFLVVLMAFGLPLLCVKLLCKATPAKNYECTQYSVECELRKDVVLIMPISYDSTLLDVYGDLIKDSQFNYYVFSPKVGVLTPVTVYTSKRCGGECVTYNYNPTPTDLCAQWEGIQSVEYDLTNLIPGVTDAIVIISGPNEIVPYTNNGAQILYSEKND